MSDVCISRLWSTLDAIADSHDRGRQSESDIVAAIFDAWSLIDACHRIRRLILQVPVLRHNTPALQNFLRATEQVQTLRDYVQHFASEIPSIPQNSYPLWGALSWVPSFARNKCYTILTGNLMPEINAPSCAYDTHKLEFANRLVLYAAGTSVDLQQLAKQVDQLHKFFVNWLSSNSRFKIRQGNVPIMRFEVNPVLG